MPRVLSAAARAITKIPDPGVGRCRGLVGELYGLGAANRIGGGCEVGIRYRADFDRLCDLEGVVAAGAGGDDQLHVVRALCTVGMRGVGESRCRAIAQVPLVTQNVVDCRNVRSKIFGEWDTALIRQTRQLDLCAFDDNVIRHDQGVFTAVLTGNDQSNRKGPVGGVVVRRVLQCAGISISEIPIPGGRVSGR